jgi:hypothetical protein
MRLTTGLFCALIVCPLTMGAPPAWAQSALPLGTTTPGKTTDIPTEYAFQAASAGVLVVAVQGEGDLVIEVLDADGQHVPDGTADRDLNGDTGRELLAVVLSAEGEYRVRIRAQGGAATRAYEMTASWLAFPAFARPEDPDGRASQARAIDVGESVSDTLDAAAGDSLDWYVITAGQSGTLVVVTRPEDGGEPDLVLEAFLDGDFSRPAAHSDQDLQGNSANESVSVSVKAGQTVHIKVSGAFSSVRGAYRLSSTLMP